MADKPKVNKSNELIGLVYLLIAALLGVAYYVPAVNSGPLGKLLVNLGKGLVGPAAYVFPLLFLLLSVGTFLQHSLIQRKIRVNHIFVLFLLTASLFHAFSTEAAAIAALSYDEEGRQTAFKAIQVLWKASQDPGAYSGLETAKPGGILGGLVCMGLQRTAGSFGAKAILITASLSEAVILFNFSIERILQGLGAILRFIFVSVGGFVQQATDALYELTGGYEDEDEPESDYREEAREKSAASGRRSQRRQTAAAEAEREPSYSISGLPPLESEFGRRRAFSGTDSFYDSYGQRTRTERGRFAMPEVKDVPESERDEEFLSPDFILPAEESSRREERRSRRTERSGRSSRSGQDGARGLQEEDFLLQGADEIPIETAMPVNSYDELSRLPEEPQRGGTKAGEKSTGETRSAAERSRAAAGTADAADKGKADAEGKKEEEIPDLLEEAESEKPYEFPPLTLLEPRPVVNTSSNAKRIHDLAKKLEDTLASFGVEAKVVHITTGPSITRFELRPGPGVKISRIVNLSDDIALSLAATAVRIEAPIPGKSAIGIEIPNTETAIVGLRSLIENEDYRKRKEKLLVPLGRDIPGQPIYCDLSKMPHLMIAGATGSGKSICINSILISLLYRCSPKELKLLLIDPKVVELSVYGGTPHLLAPVVTDPKKAANTLNWAVKEMNDRYKLFAEKHVRDMRAYNEAAEKEGYEKLPYIVLIIDELSDLMAAAANEVEEAISRLTAMARAAGIHLIIATQRPSVDVITGVIKANIPSRIAFAVSSQVDSRTILDGGGAEKLLGKGDMLYAPQSASKPRRGQGAFVSDREVENVISFLKAQNIKAYDKKTAEAIVSTPAPGVDTGGSKAEPDEDELLPDAVEVILDAGYASVSVLQRRLNIGYPRAGRLIDSMEMKGYVGPFEGSKPRKVLLTRTEWALKQAQDSVEEDSAEEDA